MEFEDNEYLEILPSQGPGKNGKPGRNRIKTSEKQKVANRANSLKSTGPITDAGKETVSQNAIKHGLRGQRLLFGEESEEEYAAFHAGLMESLAPVGHFEQMLAEQVVSNAWRLRRGEYIEKKMFEELITCDKQKKRSWIELERMNYYLRHGESPKRFQDMRNAVCDDLGSALQNDMEKILLIARYESSHEHAMFKLLHELERVQAKRQGQPVAAPLAVDVLIDAALAAQSPVSNGD